MWMRGFFMTVYEKIRKLFTIPENNRWGIAESSVAEAEKRLGVKFPRALRDYYLLFGNNKKLDIDCELFKLEDIYFEDEQYLVLGIKWFASTPFAIKIEDLQQDNPTVYEKWLENSYDKLGKREEAVYKWRDVGDTEKFLLSQAIDSGLAGGLKYRLKKWPFQDTIHEDLLCLKSIKLEEQTELAHAFNYFTGDYDYIVEMRFTKNNKLASFRFGTNHQDIYQAVLEELHGLGIKIRREPNRSAPEYRLHTKPRPAPRLTFLPGEYIEWEYRKNQIYIPEDGVLNFLDVLKESNDKFDYYGVTTEYNREQIQNLIEGLETRLSEMRNDPSFHFTINDDNFDYYHEKNVHYRRYKRQIWRMLADLIAWLQNIKEDKINILGV
jgi:hypothetical protein